MLKIQRFSEVPEAELFARTENGNDVSGAVREILRDVRQNGDAALRKYAERFDGGAPDPLEATEQELSEALSSLDPALLPAMRKAAANIEYFHREQLRRGFELRREGVTVGQRVIPIARVGLYVPGGTAPLFSTVLMNAIPAKIAGCGEIVLATPAKNGKIAPAVLAAAKIAGVHRVFKVGGAQAIAALAFGTESVPKVDKIVGPGNAFVAEAKRQVFGTVGIDMIAGPSEILVLADESADPAYVAADLLSQAEHDVNASAVLVTDAEALAERVLEELKRQLADLPRSEIARASLERNGKIIVTDDLMEAVEAANRLAPEHLELYTREPFRYLDAVKNAGSVFLGGATPEAVGDYFAGCNHTLPTGGTARFSSPLSVDDFVKKSQYICYDQDTLRRDSADIALLAEAEGLSGHARSVTVRREADV